MSNKKKKKEPMEYDSDCSPYEANFTWNRGKSCRDYRKYHSWKDWWNCKTKREGEEGYMPPLKMSFVEKIKFIAQQKAALVAKVGKTALKYNPTTAGAYRVAENAVKVAERTREKAEGMAKQISNTVAKTTSVDPTANANEAYYIGQLAVAAEVGDSNAAGELAVYYANKSMECSQLAQMYYENNM